MSSERFSYVVGRWWDENDHSKGIACYSYGGEVQQGTMKDALAYRKWVTKQTADKTKVWKIFQLVEIPE